MNKEEAIIEINRRLNILNSKPIPKIDKRDLREGIRNLPQRKEIGRYNKEINKQKRMYNEQLINLNSTNLFSAMSREQESEPENIDLGFFNNLSMIKTRKSQGRGYFW